MDVYWSHFKGITRKCGQDKFINARKGQYIPSGLLTLNKNSHENCMGDENGQSDYKWLCNAL